MKKLLLTIVAALTLSTPVLAQKTPVGVTYDLAIIRVIDGDTVVFKASFLPAPLKKELSLRVYGVDTPETGFRAKCPEENERGMAASNFTKTAIASAKSRKIVLYGWDKYGGRVLGDIVLDGQSLRALLIQGGFAKEYYGDTKQSWCN